MIEPATDASVAAAVALLIHYSFDLGGQNTEQLIGQWLNDYPANWVRLAVIEALYQGRYKAVSVSQILSCWQRRNQPLYHFNHEFERLVSNKFPQNLTAKPDILRENDAPVDVMVRSLAQKLRDRARSSPENGKNIPAIAPKQPSSASPTAPAPAPTTTGISTFSQPPVVPPTPSSDSRVGSPIITSHLSRLPKLLPPSPSPAPVEAELPTLGNSAPVPAPVLASQPEQPEANGPESGTEIETSQPVQPAPKAERSRSEMSKGPIDRFTPTPERSEFYSKLKAVAQHSDDTLPGHESGPRMQQESR